MNTRFVAWTGLVALIALSACAPKASAPSEANVPLKAGETYVLEVRGVQISKGNTYTLQVNNTLERRKTSGRDWFYLTGKSLSARGISFNYYPDRDHLSVVVLLDAAVDSKTDKATRLEVIYCELSRSSNGWSGDANYDPGLQNRTLRDGTCTLRRT